MENVLRVLGSALGFIVVILIIGFFAFHGKLIEALALFLFGPAAPYLAASTKLILIFEFFIVLPLSFIPKIRNFCSKAMFFVSIAWGLMTWTFGYLSTFIYWGNEATFYGVLMAGVGVIPFGFFGALLHGEWMSVFSIAMGVLLTYSALAIGNKLSEDADYA